MGSIRPKSARLLTLGVLAIGGLIAALAVACGGGETQIEVQTVIVEKQLPGQTITEKVVETVVVEREVEGKTVMVVETVIVEKPVTRIETVIETVIVEKPVTRIETVVETVVVEKSIIVVATPVAPPTPAPTPVGGPSGTFRLSIRNIIPPLFVPRAWRCRARAGLRVLGHGRVPSVRGL